MRKALLIAVLLAGCGSSGSNSPSCSSTETCVQATGGDACRTSCVLDGGVACPNGGVCQTWSVCCTGPYCTTALAAVCCPAGGC